VKSTVTSVIRGKSEKFRNVKRNVFYNFFSFVSSSKMKQIKFKSLTIDVSKIFHKGLEKNGLIVKWKQTLAIENRFSKLEKLKKIFAQFASQHILFTIKKKFNKHNGKPIKH
jgi:hypothetical protein